MFRIYFLGPPSHGTTVAPVHCEPLQTRVMTSHTRKSFGRTEKPYIHRGIPCALFEPARLLYMNGSRSNNYVLNRKCRKNRKKTESAILISLFNFAKNIRSCRIITFNRNPSTRLKFKPRRSMAAGCLMDIDLAGPARCGRSTFVDEPFGLSLTPTFTIPCQGRNKKMEVKRIILIDATAVLLDQYIIFILLNWKVLFLILRHNNCKYCLFFVAFVISTYRRKIENVKHHQKNNSAYYCNFLCKQIEKSHRPYQNNTARIYFLGTFPRDNCVTGLLEII